MVNSSALRSAVIAAALLLIPAASAGPCVVFDTEDKLYFLGLATLGVDSVAPDASSWSSDAVFTPVATQGRPPFDGPNTQCYLSHYINSIYVLNGDRSKPADVHIYDVAARSWSTQSVAADGAPNFATAVTALDHNTNVFYSYDLSTGGTLSFLNMGEARQAGGAQAKWQVANSLSFGGAASVSASTPRSQYPAVGPAHNHLYYVNFPGASASQSRVFVIHYSYEQPEVVSYGGDSFPAKGGVGVMTFRADMQPSALFAFIPYDGTGTYIIDTNTNTTVSLPAPPKELFASSSADGIYNVRFAAGTNQIVGLSADGTYAAYIPYTGGAGQGWTPFPSLARKLQRNAAANLTTTTTAAAATTPATAATVLSSASVTNSPVSSGGASVPAATADAAPATTSKPSAANAMAASAWTLLLGLAFALFA
ncbi:hypothetical protein HDU96_007897 [Phlyctochytrium bullatum]|nr:hypothetical protein HDU96_007897 [Phlyctochytrium bullatum]